VAAHIRSVAACSSAVAACSPWAEACNSAVAEHIPAEVLHPVVAGRSSAAEARSPAAELNIRVVAERNPAGKRSSLAGLPRDRCRRAAAERNPAGKRSNLAGLPRDRCRRAAATGSRTRIRRHHRCSSWTSPRTSPPRCQRAWRRYPPRSASGSVDRQARQAARPPFAAGIETPVAAAHPAADSREAHPPGIPALEAPDFPVAKSTPVAARSPRAAHSKRSEGSRPSSRSADHTGSCHMPLAVARRPSRRWPTGPGPRAAGPEPGSERRAGPPGPAAARERRACPDTDPAGRAADIPERPGVRAEYRRAADRPAVERAGRAPAAADTPTRVETQAQAQAKAQARRWSIRRSAGSSSRGERYRRRHPA
jgi:translation initiation factor IF-2